MIDTGNLHAKYVIAIDPLGGFSNIEGNAFIGNCFFNLQTYNNTGKNHF